jgi:hypothetical protein
MGAYWANHTGIVAIVELPIENRICPSGHSSNQRPCMGTIAVPNADPRGARPEATSSGPTQESDR